jgi:hypothetical protein
MKSVAQNPITKRDVQIASSIILPETLGAGGDAAPYRIFARRDSALR